MTEHDRMRGFPYVIPTTLGFGTAYVRIHVDTASTAWTAPAPLSVVDQQHDLDGSLEPHS